MRHRSIYKESNTFAKLGVNTCFNEHPQEASDVARGLYVKVLIITVLSWPCDFFEEHLKKHISVIILKGELILVKEYADHILGKWKNNQLSH